MPWIPLLLQTVAFGALALATLGAQPAYSSQQSTGPDLARIRDVISAELNTVPSLAVAVVRGGALIWEQAFGQIADNGSPRPSRRRTTSRRSRRPSRVRRLRCWWGATSYVWISPQRAISS